ncbi:MAG: preprotein translocase subunit SecE [Patescibacteria group bacterium]
MFARIKTFFEESRQEFRHINWPTFAETRRLTFVVIGFSLALSVFLGLLDVGFRELLGKFIF